MDWHGGGYGPSGYPPASQHHQHAHGVTGQPSFPEQHGSYVQGPQSFQTAGYRQSTYPSTANTKHQPPYEIKQTSTSTPSIANKSNARKPRVVASLELAFPNNFLACKRLQKQS